MCVCSFMYASTEPIHISPVSQDSNFIVKRNENKFGKCSLPVSLSYTGICPS